MAKQYPQIISEKSTLAQVAAGKSIARYGDGEFKIIRGGDCVSQVYTPALAQELREVLTEYNDSCLVGIPNMTDKSPKRLNWQKRKFEYAQYLRNDKTYGSAFITRPDSAPWIANRAFFDRMESLWAEQHVALLTCGERSLSPKLMVSAAKVSVVLCPRRDAYAQIKELERAILATKCERVILCAGPTATCLASRLSRHDVHACDLGHVGMFWRRYDLLTEWQNNNPLEKKK
jgi:hypothetical protein